jgi:mRNA interferase RelE/StbE
VKVDFKKSFSRDLKKIRDKELLKRVKEAIEQVENAMHLQSVSNLKQLRGGVAILELKSVTIESA